MSLQSDNNITIDDDRLQQFLEQDEWHFSESDSEDDEASGLGSESEEDHTRRLTKGPWVDLCMQSAANSDQITGSTDSINIEALIDSFLSQLGDYEVDEFSEDNETDNSDRDSQATPLLEMEGGSEPPTPFGTIDKRQNRKDDTPKPVLSEEDQRASKPPHYYIAKELLTSERTYIQGIRLLEKVLHGSIKTARKTRKPVLPEGFRKRIFLNIGEIHALNHNLLEELEKRIESWGSDTMIADIMVERAPFFKLYSMYTSRFEDSQLAFTEAVKRYKAFAELVQLIEESTICKGLPLTSYMLYPIQRIPRYRLLLEDYLKHLPGDHPDVINSQTALKSISEVAQHLNDRIKDLEQQAIVVKLQKSFAGKENLIVPGRQFLLRGPAELVSGRKLNKRKRRVIFLFSDVLMITKVTRSLKFKIIYKLSLSNLQISSMHSKVTENSFCLFSPSISKPFRLCARNDKERDKFVKSIHLAIAREIERNRTFATQKLQLISDLATREAYNVILHSPSFISAQPAWMKKPLQPRNMTVCPSSTAEPVEDVDSSQLEEEEMDVDIEFEGYLLADNDEEELMEVSYDDILSSYIEYQVDNGRNYWMEKWFVLNWVTLVAYDNHQVDMPFLALTLTECLVDTNFNDEWIIKITTTTGITHFLRFNNEYDYIRWGNLFQEIYIKL